MFPTAGYFRSTNCPFFVHGLCHRPYCHFRHSKPGLKASKSRTSPHKNNIELQSNNVKTTTPSPDVSDGDKQQADIRTTPPEATKRKVETVDNTSPEIENKFTTQTNTASKRGILNRGDEEQNIQDDQLFSVKESLPKTSLDVTEPVTSSHMVSPSDEGMEMSEWDRNDCEQPIASLTDEEIKIIGLTTVSLPGCNQTAVKSTNLGQNSTSNASSCIVSQSNSPVVGGFFENDTEGEGQMKGNLIDVNVTETYIAKEARIAQIKADSLAKRLKSKAVKEKNDSSLVLESNYIEKKQELTGGKEKYDVTQEKPQRRKSVQLQISVEGDEDMKESLDIPAKKRKSQQLPCATSSSLHSSALKSEDSNKATKRKDSISKQEYKLHELFLSASKSLEHTIHSSKSPMDNDSKDIKKGKANASKRKLSLAETEINFFGPSKRQNKTEKMEKQKKVKEEIAAVKTLKPKKLENRGLEKKNNFQKTKLQTSAKGLTMSSEDSDYMCSPAGGDSSHEENDSLRRIWNNFELPQDNLVIEKDSQSPVKKQAQESTRKRTLSSVSNDSDVIKQPSMADALGLGKKQRVAHMPSHLPRRLSSNANPVRRYPKSLTAIQRKEESEAPSTSGSPVKEAEGYKPAKQRVAHVLKNNSPAGSLPRPRIPVEYGAKVPQSQRQRYLDRIVDEYLRICSSEKEAFEKAVEEEKTLYERSTRRQVYLNLCVNAIKKLRGITQLESPSPVKSETTTKVLVTKTLSSGAVVVSTKSPAKQQPAVPQMDPFTEELMYDFLSKYLMSEDDLVQNGYPRPCPTAPGRAIFKTKKEPSKDPTRRTCCRCGKPFVVLEDGVYLTREECVYHAGKLFRRRGEPITNYSCCQGDAGSPGCCVGKVHVSDNVSNTEGFMTTIVSPLVEKPKKIFSMDCEMCYTTSGLELTRITVINWNLERVYDTFVIPERTIVDYNTRFSGVTEESLHGVTTTIHEVQAVLLSMIHKDTILVGHSLESDLKATKIIHNKVVDTSVVFPHRLGPPYKRALRNLTAEHLKKIIQDSVDGHDSYEDASACLELMRWKVKEDMKKTSRQKSLHQAFAVS